MAFSPDIYGAEVIPSHSFWPGRKPEWPISGIVQHYTGARAERGLVNWMGTPASKNSAHLFIFRTGYLIQMVRFADRAFHAGEKQSKGFWKGQQQPTNVNNFTIGIENCNSGWLLKDGKDFYLPKKTSTGYVNGSKYKGPLPEEGPDHLGNTKWWEPYSDKLVATNIVVCKRIVDRYPDITAADIGFHSDVSPHRKSDPGPLWPHEYILSEIFGSNIDAPKLAAATEPDEDDDITDLEESRGDNALGDENPEWHYDYGAQMSMIDRVVDLG